MPVSPVYLNNGGQIIMGRQLSDTHWEIYCLHLQSGCILLLDTLCQTSSSCLAVWNDETFMDKQTDR